MDPRLLHYYNLELQHLREMGGEFAQQFPKIAARLGMSGLEVTDPYVERLLEGAGFLAAPGQAHIGAEVTDPYVERLLEGAGFLAARVQLKIDSEFPRFTQSLLEIIYPHFLAPTPSMLVAQLKADPNDPNVAAGPTVPRGSMLFGALAEADATACE